MKFWNVDVTGGVIDLNVTLTSLSKMQRHVVVFEMGMRLNLKNDGEGSHHC